MAKIVRCNWKVAMEAFAEGYHVSATHPQGTVYVMDPGSQIDIYGSFARQISPSGVPSPLITWEASQEDILRGMLDVREGEPLPVELEPGQTAREAMARAARTRWRPVLGDRIEEFCDAELVDHFNYTVFPNIHPWGGFNRIVYRFRPNGDDHETSIFEVMYVTPFAGERPAPATLRSLGADDRWTDAAGAGQPRHGAGPGHVQHGAGAEGAEDPAPGRRHRLALPGGHRPLAPGPPRRVGGPTARAAESGEP